MHSVEDPALEHVRAFLAPVDDHQRRERTATGVRGRRGKFEHADGGTLFLDEISDLSMAAQAKLLRAIQDLTVERVGGNGPRQINTRIVAATNRPLASLVDRGLPSDDALARVLARLQARASDAELEKIPEGLGASHGNRPATAGRPANPGKALGASRGGGPPAGVPANGGKGKKK